MTDLPRFLPWFGEYRTRVLCNESDKNFFSKFVWTEYAIEKDDTVDSMWRVWSLRTTDAKEVVAKKIFRV